MTRSITFDYEALAPYRHLSDEELTARIRAHKENLKNRMLLFVHNYQRAEIVALADCVGDSLELARIGSQKKDVPNIVFCGVHFMAETARILAAPEQRVFLPNLSAGCPMADLADIEEAEAAWKEIESIAPGRYLPVTYVNSTAELKALCGRAGGLTVTSGNAEKVLRWVLDQDKKIFFLPDEHLGRNTARMLGIGSDKTILWDPTCDRFGGNDPSAIKTAEAILWKGYCHVHTAFTPAMIHCAREEHPEAVIMVHPECPEDVVLAADKAGSTKAMADYVREAPGGSVIILGTEVNHPRNLQKQYPGKTILPLARSLCPNMFKINLKNLCWTLDRLGEVNEVRVADEIVDPARAAVERMLSIS